MNRKYDNSKSKYVLLKGGSDIENQEYYINDIIKFFLQFRTDIKLFHWQTKLYAYHKISDELLTNIDLLSDKLIEALLGRFNTRPNISESINIRDMTIELFNKELNIATQYLTNMNINFTEILNIRDEVLGEIDKAKYLLSFK
jgi:hypothetical protein